MAALTPTPEQARIVAAFETEQDLVIQAGAGAGKTSTLKLCAATTADRGAYLAYNRAIATDAAASFPGSVTCKTAHAFAFGAVGKFYAHRLNAGRIPARRVAQLLRLTEILTVPAEPAPVRLAPEKIARLVMSTIARFCYSAELEPRPWHVPELAGVDGQAERQLRDVILPYARTAWADIERKDGALPFTHDCYLKLWQLAGPRIACDYLLLDEAQDTNPVVAEIVRAQGRRGGCQLVLVGDSCQQIYAWRGAQDVMTDWPGAEQLLLSQSFRFGPAVAAEANKWLGLLQAPLRLTGFEQIRSEVVPAGTPGEDAVLCRTNAGAISEVMGAAKLGRKVALVGGGEQIRKLAQAAVTLQAGKGTDHPELMAFESWGQLQEYVEHDQSGSDLRSFVRMIDKHGVDVMLATVDDLVGEDRADLVVSTAHKAKGREWGHVRIGNDFAEPAEDSDGPSRPEAMLAYVAVTRAQRKLDLGSLSWIDDWYPVRRRAQAELPAVGG